MGMGHAVYKTYDPRSSPSKNYQKNWQQKQKNHGLTLQKKVEQTTID